jgi:photosystem II stability/assembly factor-like uncharacterized protein
VQFGVGKRQQKWIDDGCPQDAFVAAPSPATIPVSKTTAVEERSWHPTNAPTASSRYDDVWFNDADQGWAVNSNGQILHTKNGGTSWKEQFHDPAVYMRCIAFASSSRGWVGTITEGHIFYETSNSGKTWTAVTNLPTDAPAAVCGLSVVSELTVYAAGSNHPEQPVRMMKTVDGGKSWTAWDMRRWADNLIDVYFVSPELGWVVGGNTDDRVNQRSPSFVR